MDLSINWIMFGDIQAFDKYLTVIITQNSYNLALPWVFMPSDVLFLLVSNRALWHPIWYPHTAYSRTCAKAKLIHGSAHLSKILCFSPPLAIITTHHLGLSCINICKVPVLPFLIIVSCLVWDCVANVVPRTIWESWGFEFEILVKILLSFFSSFLPFPSLPHFAVVVSESEREPETRIYDVYLPRPYYRGSSRCQKNTRMRECMYFFFFKHPVLNVWIHVLHHPLL